MEPKENLDEIEKVTITKTQYSLLNDIRGLQQDAHYMVILAKEAPNGYVLEGTDETFNHLIRDLYDELELAPKSKLRALHSLIRRIEPEYDDSDC